jgi:Aspartate decarboxylase
VSPCTADQAANVANANSSSLLQGQGEVAGANSIFIGDVLLTTKNPRRNRGANLLDRFDIASRLARLKQLGEHAMRKLQEQLTNANYVDERQNLSADLHYEGSISLMDAAGFLINERVEIHKIETGARFASYLIEAPRRLAP